MFGCLPCDLSGTNRPIIFGDTVFNYCRHMKTNGSLFEIMCGHFQTDYLILRFMSHRIVLYNHNSFSKHKCI